MEACVQLDMNTSHDDHNLVLMTRHYFQCDDTLAAVVAVAVHICHHLYIPMQTNKQMLLNTNHKKEENLDVGKEIKTVSREETKFIRTHSHTQNNYLYTVSRMTGNNFT